MVAWVASRLAVPGVHAASGRTPPGTARGWHSAPELVSGGGTRAAVAVRPAAAVRVGDGATGSELDDSSGGAADEGRDSADAVTGGCDGCDGGLGGAAAGFGVEQAARGSSSSTAARFTGFPPARCEAPPGRTVSAKPLRGAGSSRASSPGVQGRQHSQNLGQRRLRALLSDLDVAEATDEPGRDARGDDSEQGDADQHQGAADQAPGSGRGVAIAVADGGDPW